MAAIEIPEEVYDALRVPEDERDGLLREELALSLYARGALSSGKARQLADRSEREFARLLPDRGIERHYTEEELDEDLEYDRR